MSDEYTPVIKYKNGQLELDMEEAIDRVFELIAMGILFFIGIFIVFEIL